MSELSDALGDDLAALVSMHAALYPGHDDMIALHAYGHTRPARLICRTCGESIEPIRREASQ